MKTIGSFLIAVALVVMVMGCGGDGGGESYILFITSTSGGSVVEPGEGTFAYEEEIVIDLVAEPDEGYVFVGWTGDVDTIADVCTATTTITVRGYHRIEAHFALPIPIRDWYDLHATRDNLAGAYLLMNDLDSTTPGYQELAGPLANGGKGWQPLGTRDESVSGFFDGQGYEISDLYINRPDGQDVGLFGVVDGGGVIRSVGVINHEVSAQFIVGSLVGYNTGIVSNSYSSGNVSGGHYVGGLVGVNLGTVSNSQSQHSASGNWYVGGLVGCNDGTVNGSYSSGTATGGWEVGGLAGGNYLGTLGDSHSTSRVVGIGKVGGLAGRNYHGAVSDSYFSGNVTGYEYVGGLVGVNEYGSVSNSHYSCDNVLINEQNIITIGALYARDFDQWLAQGKFLDISERLSQEDGYYVINNLTDFKEVLVFGQDGALRFRLSDDLDLAHEPNFYIPYLAGEFDGHGHTISDLTLDLDFASQVGLFGFCAPGGIVSKVGADNVSIAGLAYVGGIVGFNQGTVSECYSAGSVTSKWGLGGLVGHNHGTVRESYSSSRMTGDGPSIGGLVGSNAGTVSKSYSTGSVTGDGEAGGLVGCNSGTVTSSFWDVESSGIDESDGGTGKTTAEMQSLATFLGVVWDIVAVADLDIRNIAYVWNIVDGVTYPFLSWEPVS